MKLFDLSFRVKIPLWGAVLILATALSVSAVTLFQAYDELKEDQGIDSEVLSSSLTSILFPIMLHDNTWRAYELISKPVRNPRGGGATKFEAILVVDRDSRVFAATSPREAPILRSLASLGRDYLWLSARIGKGEGPGTLALEPPESRKIYYVTPVGLGESWQGNLIMVASGDAFVPRFSEFVSHGWLVGAVLLAVLLPFNWYWGQRMARPLVELTKRMGQVGKALPEDLDPRLYGHRDELGALFNAYNQMLKELRHKAELEKQMIQSERLAALGQLAAGVAHEINNPLGGMLTAIDTLKCHGELDARTTRTIALVERGLLQIKDTVGALLVEARIKSRNLHAQDLDDVRTLVASPVKKKAITLDWQNEIDGEVSLPASLIRQILINLVLNAVQAAAPSGVLRVWAGFLETEFCLAVENDGKLLNDEQIGHLFEPFSPLSEGGHGLGLWVTYQIVQQIGGRIHAERTNGRMRFIVQLPLVTVL